MAQTPSFSSTLTMSEPETGSEFTSNHDPLVVRTADLKIALDRFILDFKSRHDGKTTIHKKVYGTTTGEFTKWEDLDFSYQQGPIGWIEQETGISARRLWTILNLETKHTGLVIADQLLQGLEMTYVYHNGEC